MLNNKIESADSPDFELSKRITVKILNFKRPSTILDAPCGQGWLPPYLKYPAEIDGLDLFEEMKPKYRRFIQHNLDLGVPSELPSYDCIVCCEGIEHFGNPLLFLKSALDHLNPNGFLLITTPNTWHPAARVRFLMRGFFPGFSPIAGKIKEGDHVHLMPWSYPQLNLYLKLAGFRNISMPAYHENCPKHFWEKMVALPQLFYARHKQSKAPDEESRSFWKSAQMPISLYARQLIVIAEK